MNAPLNAAALDRHSRGHEADIEKTTNPLKNSTTLATRASGPSRRRSVLEGWCVADIRRELAREGTAALAEQADDIAHLPPVLRSDLWWYLSALALELGSRALAAEAAGRQDGAA